MTRDILGADHFWSKSGALALLLWQVSRQPRTSDLWYGKQVVIV